jgi:hypothetical protein
LNWVQWLIPVITGTGEIGIGKFLFKVSPGGKVRPFSKKNKPGVVVLVYNPTYSGGRGRSIKV